MTKKAYAKVNIFLKIVGTRDNYHELISRFMKLSNLYDTISFEPLEHEKEFELVGNFGCELEKNSIYKAYLGIKEHITNDFFKTHRVVVEKNIPEFAGLGGGSSDAATFLLLTNEVLNLGLSKKQLATTGEKIGADVPFFIYEYPSANVSGIGEIVEAYDEERFSIKTFTPAVKCDTVEVYKTFRSDYLGGVDKKLAKKLAKLDSKEILQGYEPSMINDLLFPAVDLYPQLSYYQKPEWFFSGSGSSFFTMDDN